jgi:ABC-type antimicrobial peptide transport system permease subunit
VIAVVGGAVLATAAGARRTETAPDRYQRAFGGEHDLIVTQEDNPPTTAAVAELPAVSDVRAMSFMFAGGFVIETETEIDALVFAGTVEGAEARLVEGRPPDASNVDEFVSTESMAEQSGMSLGDTARFVSITPEDRRLYGFDTNHANGPTWEAELVGIISGPSELEEPTPIVLFSEALLADGRIANASTLMAVTLADGAAVADLREQLDTAIPGEDFRIDPATTISDEIRTAVRGQSIGLWLLAGFGALAAAAALGHLLSRSVRLTSDEQRSLSALGYTPAQLARETAGRAAIVVAGAMLSAVAVAIACSELFPFGFARRIEPSPGLRVELLVLAAGSAALSVTLVAWVAVAAALRRPSGTAARAGAFGALASRSPWPTLSTGVRFAFTRRGGESVSIFASVGGTMLSVAALFGTLTFGVSLDRLIDEPARYGENFDVMMDNGADVIQPELLEIALNDPSVTDVEVYRTGLTRVGDTTLPLITSEHLRGAIDPVLIGGRLPSGDREIALGGVSARKLGVEIGDTITLISGELSSELEVVGLVVPPGVRGFDLLGENAYVDGPAFDVLFPGLEPQIAALRFAPGGNIEARNAAIAELLGVAVDDTDLSSPAAIVNLSRVTFVPYALSALLLSLGAIALVGALWTGVRRREHQAAVLRALGANRGWLLLAAMWQALVFTVVPAVAGAAIGLIAGRLVFGDFARSKGVVDDVATPWLLGLASITLLVLLAVVAATLAGRRARSGEPARLLRAG